MAKKVKCIECDNCMNLALPANVNHENINHAKHCLDIAKRTVVCGWTMKTKRRDNEQYCKHFVIAERSKDYFKQLEELEKKIERYEKKVNFVIDENKLIEEIAGFKRCQKSENCDYLTGYISALSAVEGMIAEQPKVGEWIPCSSGKLPQRQDSENFNLEMYLVRLKDNRIRLGYRDEKGTWRNEHWNKLNVIEWKPIDTEPCEHYRSDDDMEEEVTE